jgi:hypothetical protein
MKIKIWLSLLAVAFLASTAFSQALVISPKKTVYTRKGKVSFKEKRAFIVTYPIVSGAISAAVRKKLENTISYWRVFETTLAENLRGSDWLSEMSYKVNYNKRGVLDIALTQEGSGAYPDSQTVNLVIDLKTGAGVKFDDVFYREKRTEFAALVNQKLDAEKRAVIKDIDDGKFSDGANDKESDKALKEQLEALEFTAETFDEFSVSDRGVTIIYDAGFPHVIQAAQPDGRYFFSWAEIKPFIKPAGLLGRFIR